MKHISFCLFSTNCIDMLLFCIFTFVFCIVLFMPEIGVRVHDEAHGEDLCAHLHRVDARENWLQLLLII